MNAGRREVVRMRARLDSAFTRIESIDENAIEARADFAKYLCVRVSGYLETAISELLVAYARERSSAEVARYLRYDLERFQNAKKGKIIDLADRFSKAWGSDLEAYLIDERAAAIGTIVANRHRIAHGQDSDLTYLRVREHWRVIQEIVDHFADLVDPPPGA